MCITKCAVVYMQNSIHFSYLITQKSARTNNCKAAELLPAMQWWCPGTAPTWYSWTSFIQLAGKMTLSRKEPAKKPRHTTEIQNTASIFFMKTMNKPILMQHWVKILLCNWQFIADNWLGKTKKRGIKKHNKEVGTLIFASWFSNKRNKNCKHL